MYRWQRPGQYVEWLALITGRHADVLERGWGKGPFDRRKVVFGGFGPASQDRIGGFMPVG